MTLSKEINTEPSSEVSGAGSGVFYVDRVRQLNGSAENLYDKITELQSKLVEYSNTESTGDNVKRDEPDLPLMDFALWELEQTLVSLHRQVERTTENFRG